QLIWHRWISRLSLILLGLGVLAVALSAVALKHRGLPREMALEGKDRDVIPDFLHRVDEFDTIGRWLVLLGVIAAVVALVCTYGLARRAKQWSPKREDAAWSFRAYSGGLTSIAVANLAVLLGVGFAAASVTGISTALGQREVDPGKHEKAASVFGTTPLIDRVAYAWGLGLIVAAIAITGWVVVSRVASRQGLKAHADVGYPPGLDHPAARADAEPYPAPRLIGWRKSLEFAVWKARLKNQTELLIWFVVSLGGVLAALLAWSELARLTGDVEKLPAALRPFSVAPDEVADLSGSWDQIARILAQVGAWALLGLIVLLIAKGRQAVKDEKTRRGINIIWDVISFWPHAVHPFAPAPYSQRVVVDLTERIRFHVASGPKGAPGRHVIVCGHSQGSLVSFAALNLLTDEELERVGLLTFGSQLRVIFPRAFPAYVNHRALASTRALLDDAWINLWRDTDPLAGPVLSWNHEISANPPHEEHFEPPAVTLPPIAGSIPTIGQVAAITEAFRVWRCGDDWRLPDPVHRPVPIPPGADVTVEAPINGLRGHGFYWSDPVWPAALTTVRHR
ncbi:MAG: hypothetical protein JWQ70_128, partial [Aeromicrobium sp.]|nr:hypothetical protein [Aeromicrobium sp.]